MSLAIFRPFGFLFRRRQAQTGRPGLGRSFLLTVGFFLLGLGVLALILALLLRYECPWYLEAALPPGAARLKNSNAFYEEFCGLHNDIAGQREWWGRFTDLQINSYLEEGFIQSGVADRILPESISQPRVLFDADRIHLAFRYGSGLLSSIITIDLRVWLPPREQNVVVMELEGFRAGALPIHAKTLLEKVSEVCRGNGISVNWYRDKQTGHPVAVLCFQEDERHSTMQLLAVKLEPGSITIKGQATDARPAHNPLPLVPVRAGKPNNGV